MFFRSVILYRWTEFTTLGYDWGHFWFLHSEKLLYVICDVHWLVIRDFHRFDIWDLYTCCCPCHVGLIGAWVKFSFSYSSSLLKKHTKVSKFRADLDPGGNQSIPFSPHISALDTNPPINVLLAHKAAPILGKTKQFRFLYKLPQHPIESSQGVRTLNVSGDQPIQIKGEEECDSCIVMNLYLKIFWQPHV